MSVPKITQQILVSFNHAVAVMLDGRAITIACAICEELFQAETSVVPKKKKADPTEAINRAEQLTLDFPLFLRILSLADGRPLKKPINVLVKWNNISAICNLDPSDLSKEMAGRDPEEPRSGEGS